MRIEKCKRPIEPPPTAPPPEGRTDALLFVLEEMDETYLDAVLEIEQAVFSNPWRLKDFQYALAKEGSYGVVCLAEGRVIGYALGFFVMEEFHLADFAVHPDLQHRGIGRQLLDVLLDVLKRRPVSLVSLEVRGSNRAAIALYRQVGFQTVAIRRGYYSRPREDALVMLKALRGKLSDWLGGTVTPLDQRI